MRYARQIALSQIGKTGQEKLALTRVLIVGIGGLGSPIALYLAAAGVGTIGIIDSDVVSVSNLQRQILYREAQVGLPKVECAADRLNSLNAEVNVIKYYERLTEENAHEIIVNYDYVIDGCDNYKTRYLINEVCSVLKTPYIYGAITDFSGQVAVFDYKTDITYKTIYPDEEYYSSVETKESPVIGTTPAVVGSIQANQLLQMVCEFGSPLCNEMMHINLLTMEFQRIIL
ncbi:MAG: HesA/MoeB/ThiF family protein [bacterium]